MSPLQTLSDKSPVYSISALYKKKQTNKQTTITTTAITTTTGVSSVWGMWRGEMLRGMGKSEQGESNALSRLLMWL